DLRRSSVGSRSRAGTSNVSSVELMAWNPATNRMLSTPGISATFEDNYHAARRGQIGKSSARVVSATKAVITRRSTGRTHPRGTHDNEMGIRFVAAEFTAGGMPEERRLREVTGDGLERNGAPAPDGAAVRGYPCQYLWTHQKRMGDLFQRHRPPTDR